MAGWLRRLLGCDDAFVPISHIEKLSLEPGDTLAVQVPGRLTGEQAARLRETLQAAIPNGVKTFVCDNSITFKVIRAVLTNETGDQVRDQKN